MANDFGTDEDYEAFVADVHPIFKEEEKQMAKTNPYCEDGDITQRVAHSIWEEGWRNWLKYIFPTIRILWG